MIVHTVITSAYSQTPGLGLHGRRLGYVVFLHLLYKHGNAPLVYK